MGYFRFRKSISILPGVRINLGKRGVSVSAGVRGAHVTFGGRGGTRATVGIPGTGVSYSETFKGPKDHDVRYQASSSRGGFWFGLTACLTAIFGGAALIARSAPEYFDAVWSVAAGACAVCMFVAIAIWRSMESKMAGQDISPIENRDDIAPQANEPNLAQSKSFRQVMEKAREQAAARALLESLLRETEKAAARLSSIRCFYKKNGQKIGPVTFWQVHELIEMDLLSPDVQVIAEGSDYWRTYAHWELVLMPPADTRNLLKLERASEIQCYYRANGQVAGPITLLGLFHYIRSGRLPPEVLISIVGTSEWRRACDV